MSRITEKDINAIINSDRIRNNDNGLKRISLDKEERLLNHVRNGDYKKIRVMAFEELEENMAPNARSRLIHFKYDTVACITLASRVAIQSGIMPDEAFDISDALLKKLDDVRDLNDVHDIFELALKVYAKKVHDKHYESGSYIVNQCKVFIGRNYYRKIYLDELADYVGVNPSYLSRCFSKNENMTVSDYIQRVRVENACDLLTHSDSSIAEITQNVGFQSQSSFSAVFRRIMGITPTEYRNINSRDSYS